VNDLALWNELTRREQRIMIKLFGGGSSHGDGPLETINLTRLGLIAENGLTSAGLKPCSLLLSKRNETSVSRTRIERRSQLLADQPWQLPCQPLG
jgi:hypothetical protein